MYSRANQFPQPISLTTKTSVYPNLVLIFITADFDHAVALVRPYSLLCRELGWSPRSTGLAIGGKRGRRMRAVRIDCYSQSYCCRFSASPRLLLLHPHTSSCSCFCIHIPVLLTAIALWYRADALVNHAVTAGSGGDVRKAWQLLEVGVTRANAGVRKQTHERKQTHRDKESCWSIPISHRRRWKRARNTRLHWEILATSMLLWATARLHASS